MKHLKLVIVFAGIIVISLSLPCFAEDNSSGMGKFQRKMMEKMQGRLIGGNASTSKSVEINQEAQQDMMWKMQKQALDSIGGGDTSQDNIEDTRKKTSAPGKLATPEDSAVDAQNKMIKRMQSKAGDSTSTGSYSKDGNDPAKEMQRNMMKLIQGQFFPTQPKK